MYMGNTREVKEADMTGLPALKSEEFKIIIINLHVVPISNQSGVILFPNNEYIDENCTKISIMGGMPGYT